MSFALHDTNSRLGPYEQVVHVFRFIKKPHAYVRCATDII